VDPDGCARLRPSGHVKGLDGLAHLDERHHVTPLVAKAVSVIVPPDEDVAARPADDLLCGIAEDLLRRSIPEDDPPVSSDDERPVTRTGERLIEHSLTETRQNDGRPVTLLDV